MKLKRKCQGPVIHMTNSCVPPEHVRKGQSGLPRAEMLQHELRGCSTEGECCLYDIMDNDCTKRQKIWCKVACCVGVCFRPLCLHLNRKATTGNQHLMGYWPGEGRAKCHHE